MSGGGGGVGGPTVNQEPGVRNEPLLIADVTGQKTLYSLINSSKTDNRAFH